MTGPNDPNWRWEFRCEDFVYARLADIQTQAEALPPGPTRDQVLHDIDCIYIVAADHNIWVDARGQSAGRCITCTPASGGVPCQTMRALARMWRDHDDYLPVWNQSIDEPAQRGSTYEGYKKRTTIWTQREAELTAFYDRFDLEKTPGGGERWRCKTCGATGETWKPMLGAYDYPHAIGTAASRHPTCERTSA